MNCKYIWAAIAMVAGIMFFLVGCCRKPEKKVEIQPGVMYDPTTGVMSGTPIQTGPLSNVTPYLTHPAIAQCVKSITDLTPVPCAKPPAKKKWKNPPTFEESQQGNTIKTLPAVFPDDYWIQGPLIISFPNYKNRNVDETYTVESVIAWDKYGKRVTMTWAEEGKTFRDHWIITPEDCPTPNSLPCGPKGGVDGRKETPSR